MNWEFALVKLKLAVGSRLVRLKAVYYMWRDIRRHRQYCRGFNRAMQLGYIEGFDTDIVTATLRKKESPHGPPCSFNVGVEVACDLIEQLHLVSDSKDVVDNALASVYQELDFGKRQHVAQ